MATGRKLKNVTVSYGENQVGLSLLFDSGTADHYLLPLNVATQLKDRLVEACEMAKPQQNHGPGDGVAVSEYVGMRINPPTKGH